VSITSEGNKEVFRKTMKGQYFKQIGGLLIAALVIAGALFVSPATAEAQRRRVVIVRPYHRFYRPFRPWGWGYYPYGPYGYYYNQYVFDNDHDASNQGYKDGFKTGKDDGKKDKSFDPQRSHYYKESGFGNFAEVYREAFSSGYQDGFRTGTNQRAG
jgi:hypothetical protein